MKRMDLPRFTAEELNAELSKDQGGDRFQRLAHDLLRRSHPNLHLFGTSGKDGGIDLSQDGCEVRTFVECKSIGENGVAAAAREWKEVEKRLGTHLASAEGPTKGQAQYGPWFDVEEPVKDYLFCVSSVLDNENQRSVLARQIRDFFGQLASLHSHLRHLAVMGVRVFDGSDFAAWLNDAPHLLFAWFPSVIPRGLGPLEIPAPPTSFRAYLNGDMLPYYSRQVHMARQPPPSGYEVPDEEGLLQWLNKKDTGLVITGGGGHGKTRLLLELGRRAATRGWVVLRVREDARPASLEALARRLSPTTPTLLLIDYIENQRGYSHLIETLNGLVDDQELQLRYIAACRTSFYPAVELTSRHRRADLAPSEESAAYEDEYRRGIVRFVLAQTGVDDEHAMAMCGATPVLAVFAAWLRAGGREADLTELLGRREFGDWVRERVHRSFPSDDGLSESLAALMAFFPIPDSAVQNLPEDAARIVERLAADGWIERREGDADANWEVVHDVLADRVILSCLERIRATRHRFLRVLIEKAIEADVLRSALLALQRLGDRLRDVGLPALIEGMVARNLVAWRKVRDLLLQTALLNPSDQIRLLANLPGLWDGIEKDVPLQNRLGWLARWSADESRSPLEPELRQTLVAWIERAAPHVTRSNFLLTCGLALEPERIRTPALAWITANPTRFQTHYLLRAWLQVGLPHSEIAPALGRWMARFPLRPHVSFVVAPWLDAGGATSLVRSPIQIWLEAHAADEVARFIYRAWLAAGGDGELVREPMQAWFAIHAKDSVARLPFEAWLSRREDLAVVREPIRSWLRVHGTSDVARHVFKAWLAADGELDLVRQPIKAWLETHAIAESSCYVFKAWLDARGEPDLVRESIQAWLQAHATAETGEFVYSSWLRAGGDFELVRDGGTAWLHAWRESPKTAFTAKFLAKQADLPVAAVSDILFWCNRFPEHPDAPWRLTQLGRHLSRAVVAEQVIDATEAVIGYLLRGPQPDPVARYQMAFIFALLVQAEALNKGPLASRLDSAILGWVRHPESIGGAKAIPLALQRVALIERIVRLLQAGALDLMSARDRQGLHRVLSWIARTWEREKVDQARQLLDSLSAAYARAVRADSGGV
jgi:hypothetical protein